MSYNAKSITDPLYGYIGLSELEADVVSSSVFQRLHNVRQLGLAHLVFPSSGYSRFAHSVGACHNAGRILDAIGLNAPNSAVKGKKKQSYRLAALLHDIGHYPFSHATEQAIQSFYVGQSVLATPNSDILANESEGEGLHHEDVGRLIIENDPELQKVFEKHKVNVKELLQIFSKAKPDVLFGIISSDLDCDRLDYLRRSAHGCGVPYGEVDIDFIISKATVDQDGILCFQSKAANAIDHFLVSRFYDYMQIVYHKTVEALEWSLECCIQNLLSRGSLRASSIAIKEKIKAGEWCEFDDSYLISQFRDLLRSVEQSSGNHVLKDHLQAVLYRRPAKLVHKWEALLAKDDKRAKLLTSLIRKEVYSIANEMGIDISRFNIIERKPFPFSSDIMKSSGGLTYGEQARSVSILEKGKRKSELLSDRQDSIIGVMESQRNFSVRVLYLPQNGEERTVRDNIRRRLVNLDA